MTKKEIQSMIEECLARNLDILIANTGQTTLKKHKNPKMPIAGGQCEVFVPVAYVKLMHKSVAANLAQKMGKD